MRKADAGLGLARQRLDVDVRDLLVVGVDDDLVDELHQLVVGAAETAVAFSPPRRPSAR
jgi:hypothetical protein